MSLILLLAHLALGQGNSNVNATQVDVSECKFPFGDKSSNSNYYYGCTTGGTNGNGTQAWCITKTPDHSGQDWKYCKLDTLASNSVLAQNNNCLNAWTHTLPTATETVYGCIYNQDIGFWCNPGGSSPSAEPTASSLNCTGMTLTSAFSSNNGGNELAGGKASGTSTGTTAGTGSVTVVAACVCAVMGCALVAGLFIVQRRRASKKTDWTYKSSMSDGAYTAATSGYLYSADVISPTNAGEKLYSVISTYSPTLGDELEIQPGDKVGILIEYDDGWCQGINHSRGGSKGVFPKHCVDMSST